MPELRNARAGWLAAAVGSVAILAAGWLTPLAAAIPLLLGNAAWASVPALRLQPAAKPLQVGGSRLWIWAWTLGIAALLAAWPVQALRQSGSLWAALALSLVAAFAVLAAWRAWTAWGSTDGDLRHAFVLASAERSKARNWAWRGLRPAFAVTAVAALALALCWPGLLQGQTRWIVAVVAAITVPLLHRAMRVAPAAVQQDKRESAPMPAPARNAEPLRIDQIILPVQDAATAAADADAVADLPPDAGSEELDRELYAAARGGRVERALALLDAGARVSAEPAAGDRDQRRLPVLAAVLPDLRLLRELIARGATLDADDSGVTPLLAATRDSWHGRPDAVAMLLANGADPRVADNDGNTPLHHAARSTDPGVAALLLDAHADINVANAAGHAPLGMACASGNWRLARFLLERGAQVAPAGLQSALIAAVSYEDDDPAGVQLLLRHKAAADVTDHAGRSALHLAAESGHSAIVQTLLDSGATASARDPQAVTPLMLAAQGGHADAVDALLESGAAATDVDADGCDALRHAVEGEVAGAEVVAALLAAGADASAAAKDGSITLQRAKQLGRWPLVALLEPGFAPPPQPQAIDAGSATMEEADTRPPYAVVSEALQAGDTATLERFAELLDRRDLSRLLAELAPTRPDVLPWLIARGADIDVQRDDGSVFATLLRQAPADAPAAQSLKLLFERGASPAGAGVFATFLSACRVHAFADGENFAMQLLERGADPFCADISGDAPLHHAVRLHWPRLRDGLLARGVDPNGTGVSGFTPLHVATACEDLDAVRALVAAGGQPTARAPDGLTPLGVALANGRRDMAKWLEWRGWPLPGRALRATDLPAAAMAGDADAVERLLEFGFDVDTTDAHGCSALLRASGGGHVPVVDLLIKRGADIGLAADAGATPLSAAVSMRHETVVDRLLAGGANLEQRLPGEVTVLMLASALGLPEMAARLIRAGAKVNAGDPQGLAPIHCAALYGFTSGDRSRLVALFDTLLLAGADANAQAGAGITPLLLLLGARAEPGTPCHESVILAGLDHLLGEGIQLDVQDPRGFGPLHIAALHGLMSVARELRDNGASLALRDRLNRTPREIALMRGFVDVAAELAESSGDTSASIAKFLRPHDRPV